MASRNSKRKTSRTVRRSDKKSRKSRSSRKMKRGGSYNSRNNYKNRSNASNNASNNGTTNNATNMKTVADIGQPSLTARYVTAHRAMATDDPKYNRVFKDPYAKYFAGKEGFERVANVDEKNHVYPTVIIRSVFIDKHMLCAISQFHVKQVVILGAGFDARAVRLHKHNVTYFEVDFKQSMQAKLEAIKKLRDSGVAYHDDHVKYVEADLEHDNESNNFVKKLEAVGYRRDVPTFYIWEGVSMYLTEAAVRKTLTQIVDSNDTDVFLVFDHFNRPVKTKHENEPFIWWTADPDPLLIECGFNRARGERMEKLYFNIFNEKIVSAGGLVVCARIKTVDALINTYFL